MDRFPKKTQNFGLSGPTRGAVLTKQALRDSQQGSSIIGQSEPPGGGSVGANDKQKMSAENFVLIPADQWTKFIAEWNVMQTELSSAIKQANAEEVEGVPPPKQTGVAKLLGPMQGIGLNKSIDGNLLARNDGANSAKHTQQAGSSTEKEQNKTSGGCNVMISENQWSNFMAEWKLSKRLLTAVVEKFYEVRAEGDPSTVQTSNLYDQSSGPSSSVLRSTTNQDRPQNRGQNWLADFKHIVKLNINGQVGTIAELFEDGAEYRFFNLIRTYQDYKWADPVYEGRSLKAEIQELLHEVVGRISEPGLVARHIAGFLWSPDHFKLYDLESFGLDAEPKGLFKVPAHQAALFKDIMLFCGGNFIASYKMMLRWVNEGVDTVNRYGTLPTTRISDMKELFIPLFKRNSHTPAKIKIEPPSDEEGSSSDNPTTIQEEHQIAEHNGQENDENAAPVNDGSRGRRPPPRRASLASAKRTKLMLEDEN